MSLPVNTFSLINEMRRTISDIDRQIVTAKRDILSQLPAHIEPSIDTPYKAKHADGKFVLTDLLVAKAGLLAAIANLQAGAGR